MLKLDRPWLYCTSTQQKEERLWAVCNVRRQREGEAFEVETVDTGATRWASSRLMHVQELLDKEVRLMQPSRSLPLHRSAFEQAPRYPTFNLEKRGLSHGHP